MSTQDETQHNSVEDEHFKPVGTMVLLGIFTMLLILLWLSVYAILVSRGATA